MSKLFEVPATLREVVFTLHSYKQNRVCNKLLKLIKEDGIFAVKSKRSKDAENYRIFRLSILSTDTITEAATLLKNEIISHIPDAFTPNYQFDFGGDRLGFTRSFEVYDPSKELVFACYHNIKEVKKNGESIMPAPKDQITL